MTALPPGSRLGPYEVVALLGEGGMGRVYRARDETTLGLAYEKVGRLPEAIKVLEEARRHDDSPTTLEMLGGAYAAAGRNADAEKVLHELTDVAKMHYVCPFEVATVYVGLKRNQEALDWLEKGYHEHADCMPWIATDSKLDPLRDNAQFRDLLSRVGLRR